VAKSIKTPAKLTRKRDLLKDEIAVDTLGDDDLDMSGSDAEETTSTDPIAGFVTSEAEAESDAANEPSDFASPDAEAEAAAYALADTDDDDVEDVSDLDARRVGEVDSSDGSDPVRMYLREIGSTPLLTADQELRICGTYGAQNLLLRMTEVAAAVEPQQSAWRALYEYLSQQWEKVLDECAARKVEPPSMASILYDAIKMPNAYTDPDISKIQTYLRALGWGQDLTVETISAPIYEVALTGVVLPESFVEQLAQHFDHTQQVPEWDEALTWMC
jgi:hypothetical protein